MFSRPLLADLVTRTRDDIVSRLNNSDLLRRSDGETYARVLAGIAHGLYGYIDWLAKQLIYDTADTDYLERWASIWGITRKQPTFATGTIALTGTIGASVPSGTLLATYDGIQYATTVSVTVPTTATPIQSVIAQSSANRAIGQTLTLQSTLPGVNSTAIASVLIGGSDLEDDDSLRSRLLTRIKQPPQGGDKADYEAWALSFPNVTRAWVYPLELGPGGVTVRFMMDNTYIDGIPLSGDVTALAAYIDPLRPVTAAVTVVAPIAVVLNFTITSLSPSTPEVKAAITQELSNLIDAEASPGGTLLLSHIREAISKAAGEYDHVLTSPAANVTNSTGYIATMGSVTWV
jgi:uncharacterized phage protein gp47/JayE